MDRARARHLVPRDFAAHDEVPLVVDLDGTLLRTDTLVETLFAVARADPASLLRLPLWLIQGRAALKRALAKRAALDVHTLPFDRELLGHLRREKRRGRRLVMATGADARIAHAIADELKLFDEVWASDGVHNFTAARKRDRLVAEFGVRGYDYVGNSARDVPAWSSARRALLVAPSARVQAAAQRVASIERVFTRERPALAYLGAMRVHHWPKNLLLLVPLLATHRLYDPLMLGRALVGVLAFSLAASGIYLLNDLLDLRADRLHPHKKRRALATGRVPLVHALAMLPALWGLASVLALGLGPPFFGVLAAYVAMMLVYSLWLKDIAIIDALVLAGGYTLRIHAGSLAVGIAVSQWLLICSVALFFGLALLKRYAELVTLRPGLAPAARVRAYRVADAMLVAGVGVAAGCIAVVLLALYPVVESIHVARLPVWAVCVLLLLWTAHMWLMAHRGSICDEPVGFALRDPTSRLLGALTAAILVLAA
jgi:4-hydroxybenzoate polyprenyltransferase